MNPRYGFDTCHIHDMPNICRYIYPLQDVCQVYPSQNINFLGSR